MRIRSCTCYIIIFSVLFLIACKKKNEPQPEPAETPALPEVIVNTYADITYNSAEFRCSLKSNGSTPVTENGICWDTFPNPDISKNKIAGVTGATNFTCAMTGLKRNSPYYFVKAYATNATGTSYSREYIFSTPGNWTPAFPGLSGKVTCMTEWGYSLFVGTEHDGVFSRSLGSAQWTSYNDLSAKDIRAMVVTEDNYALNIATSKGIFYLSMLNWYENNKGLENLNTTALSKFGVILFTIADQNVYSLNSIDGWTKLNFDSPVKAEKIWEIQDGVLIFDKGTGHLYHSDESGKTSLFCKSPASDVLDIKAFDGKLYLGASSGAYVSADRGVTWLRISDPHIADHSVSNFTEDQTGLCASVENDVFRIKATGPWLQLCPGLPQDNSVIRGIARPSSLFIYRASGTTGTFYWLD